MIITKSDGGDADQVNFTAGSNFRLYGSLYGKNTNITLGNNAEIYGSMIGRRISRDFSGAWYDINGPNIHFDQAMKDKAVCHSGRFSILRGSWFEVIP